MPVTEGDLALDREISQICGLIPLLRLLTPVNVGDVKEDFLAGRDPEFEYRPLPDLQEIENRINAVSSEAASDSVIAHMVEGLMKDLRLRLEMLNNRDTERFFLVSVEMFGHVEETTYELARQILMSTKKPARDETIGAEEFAAHAREELTHYRNAFPELHAEVRVSETTSGVMVETGDLYVGSDTRIAASRIEPLIQHEVGTHIVTYENGRAQPLHMLSLGLAGYDELQEALGVLAEHLAAGLPPSRLRVLAYRVIAAHLRSQNASFRETYDELKRLKCATGIAFSTTMRAYRSGGMTKDAIYLRGLVRLLDHLKSGTDLGLLFYGKISFESISLVADLVEREVLSEPPLTPRFLTFEGAGDRLKKIQAGIDVLGLGATS